MGDCQETEEGEGNIVFTFSHRIGKSLYCYPPSAGNFWSALKVNLICTSCDKYIEHDIHAIEDFAEVRCTGCNRVLLKRKYAEEADAKPTIIEVAA